MPFYFICACSGILSTSKKTAELYCRNFHRLKCPLILHVSVKVWGWCEKMKGNGMNKIKTYHVVTEEAAGAAAERKWKCLHKNDITHYLALLFMDLLESPLPSSSLATISLLLIHDDVCIWVLYVHKSNYDSSLHIHTYI